MKKKEDGFPGQISFVIPDKIIEMVKGNPLISDLYVTDIGYYPHARHHFRERPLGCPQFILIYCTDGQGEIRMGETINIIPTNHFFIIPAGMAHSYRSNEKTPWSIYWIHFTGVKSAGFANYSSQCYPIEQNKDSRIGERLNLFSEIFRNLDRGYSIETMEYVNLCLGHLLASFTHLNQFREIQKTNVKDPIAQSVNYMIEHLASKIKLEDIAASTGFSASHFSRLFLSQTGHSPIEYFIQLKIQRACRLLDISDLSVAEVSRELGFEDQFYFSRQFRKVMNMSPREYKKR